MRPPVVVESETRWRWNVRGPGSWELCRQAGRRRPAWSRASRSWVVSEKTARDVVAMAEAAGLQIVVTGPRATDHQELFTAVNSSGAEPEEGLW
jgi:hypothetical protein